MIWSCVIFFHRGLPSATAFPYFPRWAFHIYLNVFVCSVVRIPDHKTNALQMCTGLKNLFHDNVSSPTHSHLLFLTAINSIGACFQLWEVLQNNWKTHTLRFAVCCFAVCFVYIAADGCATLLTLWLLYDLFFACRLGGASKKDQIIKLSYF